MLTRAELHKLIDEVPEDELPGIERVLRQRDGVTVARTGDEQNDVISFNDEIEALIQGQVAAMTAAITSGPRAITLGEFVDRLKRLPSPDDQFAEDLAAIRREQGIVEPIDWNS